MTQNIQSSLKSRPAIFVRTESDGLDYAYAKHWILNRRNVMERITAKIESDWYWLRAVSYYSLQSCCTRKPSTRAAWPASWREKAPCKQSGDASQLNHYSWSIYMEALSLADRAFISSVQPASLCSDFVINKWLKPRTNSWRSRELFSPSAMMSVVSVNNDTITLRLK